MIIANKVEDINSLESEAALLASLIHNPELIYHSEYLLPKHFSDYDNQCIYTAILELVKSGITNVDSLNIIEVLNSSEATKKYAERLTVERLKEFIDLSDVLARSSVEEYKLLVKNVMDAAFRRDMYQGLRQCIDLCIQEDGEDVKERIYRIIDDTIASYSTSEDIPAYADVIDELWDEIKQRQDSGYSGIPFKFPALNDYVTIERGELVIFGAQQKVGKSMMLLNIAVDLLRQGYSVLYIDSELSSRLFTARLLTHLTGLQYRDLTSGHYTPDEEERILAAKEWIKTRKLTHLYMPFFDEQSIYTATKQVDHRQGIDVIIIDYFKSTGNNLDAYQTYAAMGRCVDLV